MNKRMIKEILEEISTPTGISHSGDRTLSKSEAECILDYMEALQQRINKAIELNEKIYDLVAFGDSENQLSELVYKLSEILKGDK